MRRVSGWSFFENYLWLEQRFLHALASAVHCATQAPNSPQFCEQAKFIASQFAMQTFGVSTWASWIFLMGGTASLRTVAANRKISAKMYLVQASPENDMTLRPTCNKLDLALAEQSGIALRFSLSNRARRSERTEFEAKKRSVDALRARESARWQQRLM